MAQKMVDRRGLGILHNVQNSYVVHLRALLFECHTVAFNPIGFESRSEQPKMVDRRGLEPRTLGLRVPCSTN